MTDLLQDLHDLSGIRTVGSRNGKECDDIVAGIVDDIGDRTVWNDDPFPSGRKISDSHGDRCDSPLIFTDLDIIPDIELSFK